MARYDDCWKDKKRLWYKDIVQFSLDLFPDLILPQFGVPKFHREIYQQLREDRPKWNRNDRLRAFLAPRGFSKTTLIQKVDVLHRVLFKQKHFIVLLSETETQAITMLNFAKDQLRTNKTIKYYFGDLTAKNERDKRGVLRKEEVVITHPSDGFPVKLWARGCEQGIRGITFLNWRPDQLNADDIEGKRNTRTPEQREFMRDWFHEDAVGAVDMHVGEVNYIGTNILNDCLINHLIDDPMWKGKAYGIVDKGPGFEIEEGNPIWPERFSKRILKQERQRFINQNNHAGWAREMLGVAIADPDRLFLDRHFREYVGHYEYEDGHNWLVFDDGHKVAINVFIGVDLSGYGRSRDVAETWFVVLGITPKNKIYVLEIIHGDVKKLNPAQTIDTFFKLHRTYHGPTFAVEKNRAEAMYEEDGGHLRRREIDSHIFLEISKVTEKENKDDRIASLHSLIASGIVHLLPEHVLLKHQFVDFPKAKGKDGADAFHKAIRKAWPAEEPETPKEPEYGYYGYPITEEMQTEEECWVW